MTNEPQTVILNVSVLPWQREMVERYMRKHGLLSMAEATRAIFTEFRNMTEPRPEIKQPAEQPA